MKTFIKYFFYSAGSMLLATSTAKLITSAGTTRALQVADPIFNLAFHYLFLVVGLIEFVVGLICLFGNRLSLKLALVIGLANCFLAYRAGLLWLGWHKPCGCLGDLTDALHISSGTADTIIKVILAYLLIGSYATFFWLWRQHKMAFASVPA